MDHDQNEAAEDQTRLGDLNMLLYWLKGFGTDGKVDVAVLRRVIRQGEFDVTTEELKNLD